RPVQGRQPLGVLRGGAAQVSSAAVDAGAISRARSRRVAPALRTVLWHVPMALGALVLLTPFFWMISTSLKEEGREFLLPLQLIPNPVLWSNYPTAMTTLPFPLYLWNTLIVTIGSLSGTVVTA